MSANACTAVGTYGTGLTLAERWGGKHWEIQATPKPPVGTFALLFGISCASARACTAVGWYTDRTGQTTALAERWGGKRWEIQATPTPSGATSWELSGVSCPSAHLCIAVGSYTYGPGTGLALVERWDGRRWEFQTTPEPPGPPIFSLSGVSCPSVRVCIAVGQDSVSAALVERWNGRTWAVQPTPAFGIGARLTEVSCPFATQCIAIGGVDFGGGMDSPLTERWNGTNWEAPTGSGWVLSGVSCTLAIVCVGVGSDVSFQGTVLGAVAERWDDGHWTTQPTPSLPGGSVAALQGVSCVSARSCTAVGNSFISSTGQLSTLAERWDGHRWEVQPTP